MFVYECMNLFVLEPKRNNMLKLKSSPPRDSECIIVKKQPYTAQYSMHVYHKCINIHISSAELGVYLCECVCMCALLTVEENERTDERTRRKSGVCEYAG